MPSQLPDFSKTNILVVGDVMLDRYWNGQTGRISPEAPVPIVRVEASEDRPGGAGNVARSITALGSRCSLVGLLGDDENGKRVEELLLRDKVALQCIRDQVGETITKLRVLSRNQQLIRLDFESHFTAQGIVELTDHACGILEGHDVLVLSDYEKGALNNIKQLIHHARSKNIPIFVDPKGNDFNRYHGATAITPNQSEFHAVVGNCETEDEIAEKGTNLLNALGLEALIITRSEKGVTLVNKKGRLTTFPARAKEVFDVTGAGDTFISVVAASYAAGSSFEEAVNIANAAASVVVGKLGAAIVSRAEIEYELNRSAQTSYKILNKEDFLNKASRLHDEGKKIIMTNGCFDILHPGHIEYLAKARELGDVLLVAVNADVSIKRLKGDSRPINKLKDRLTMLSSLQSVDWLVAFDQDTPADLITAALPDVLVKGGDYDADEVAGGDAVCANGGEVKVLDYVQSYSTSELIHKIKNTAN